MSWVRLTSWTLTNDPWDESVLIGNGSKLKVRLDVWEGKIVTLHAVKNS